MNEALLSEIGTIVVPLHRADSSMKHVLAIDQGTTGTTALIIAADGRIAGRGYQEITQHYPQPGWVEHDAFHRRAYGTASRSVFLCHEDRVAAQEARDRVRRAKWEAARGHD